MWGRQYTNQALLDQRDERAIAFAVLFIPFFDPFPGCAVGAENRALGEGKGLVIARTTFLSVGM